MESPIDEKEGNHPELTEPGGGDCAWHMVPSSITTGLLCAQVGATCPDPAIAKPPYKICTDSGINKCPIFSDSDMDRRHLLALSHAAKNFAGDIREQGIGEDIIHVSSAA